ncbi:MAG: hypothetical protein ACLT76_10260 [Clostridium fessum]
MGDRCDAGGFRESYRYEGTSVRSLLAQRLPVTVLLAVISCSSSR